MSLTDIKRRHAVYAMDPFNSATAVTAQILIPAKGDCAIVVDFFETSWDGIGTVQLLSKGGSSTAIGCKEYMAANSGKVLDTPWIKTRRGEALAVTTTIATTANYSIYIAYHYEGNHEASE